MTVNKEQFCDRCQVLTVPTARLCPHCENELKLASIESSPIEIVPGPILINRYQICKELINARITKYERSFLAQDLHSQELVSITNLYRNVDNIWIEDMEILS